MIPYASNVGGKKLAALRSHGWGILVSPDSRNKFPTNIRHAIDNGAWTAFQRKTPFDAEAFIALARSHGPTADFVVVPDIVAAGRKSLRFSISWFGLLAEMPNPLLAVQDGMDPHEVGQVLRSWPKLGIFLGGSTEWKLKTMYAWGIMAHSLGRYYHVARVNSIRRMRLAIEAGADSVDGSSPAIFPDKLVRLAPSVRQPSLLTPASQSNEV